MGKVTKEGGEGEREAEGKRRRCRKGDGGVGGWTKTARDSRLAGHQTPLRPDSCERPRLGCGNLARKQRINLKLITTKRHVQEMKMRFYLVCFWCPRLFTNDMVLFVPSRTRTRTNVIGHAKAEITYFVKLELSRSLLYRILLPV